MNDNSDKIDSSRSPSDEGVNENMYTHPSTDGNQSNSVSAIDGGTLAKKLLGDPLPNVDLLIERLPPPNRSERETPLLEFKASYLPAPGDAATEDACKWNVVEAIVSMANATGGCILLGVVETEDHRLVACGCDPHGILGKQGKESKDLIATVFKELFRKDGCYRYDEKKTFTVNEPERLRNCVSARLCHSEELDEDLLALIVTPIPENGKLITVAKTVLRNGERSRTTVLFHRSEELPRNDSIEDVTEHFDEYDEFRQSRKVARESYSAFLKPQRLLSEQIRESHNALRGRFFRFGRTTFIPLEVSTISQPTSIEPDYSETIFKRIDFEDFFQFDGLPGDCSGPGARESFCEPPAGSSVLERPRTEPKNSCVERLSAEHMFYQTPRMCLVGAPGAGKTTTLRHEALKRIERFGPYPSSLVIFLPLGAWAKEGSLLELMQHATGLQATTIQMLASSGRLHLFLDGLNECPDEYRKDAELQISKFLEKHPNSPVVVSSRHLEEVRRFQLPIWSLENMDKDRMRSFLALRLGDDQAAETLLERLLAHPEGESVASNPMFLDMLAELVKNNPGMELPVGRALLYRQWTTLWQVREERHNRRSGRVEAGRKCANWKERICSLAFEARLKGFRHVPAELLAAHPSNETAALELLSSPFVVAEPDGIHFQHETFQEYYCAEWIVSHPEDLERIRKAVPDRTSTRIPYANWGMPMAFALELFGQTPPPPAFFDIAGRLDPWFRIAALAGFSSDSIESDSDGDLPDEEPSEEQLFWKAVDSGLEPEDFLYVFFLLRYSGSYGFKGWYRKYDAPLQHLISVNAKSRQKWKIFEKEIFSLLFGDKAEFFVHDAVGSRFVANAICTHLSDFMDEDEAAASVATGDALDFLDRLSFAVVCVMIAVGFARKDSFPPTFFTKFDFTFNNPSLGEFWLLSLAGLSNREQFDVVRQRIAIAKNNEPIFDFKQLSHDELVRKIARGEIVAPLGEFLLPRLSIHSEQIDVDPMSNALSACPSEIMVSFCRKIKDAAKQNRRNHMDLAIDKVTSSTSSESIESIVASLSNRLGYECMGYAEVFKAWYGGILPWDMVMNLVEQICSEKTALDIGKSYFDEEGWWFRIKSPLSSFALFALGASDIATCLPTRKTAFAKPLVRALRNATSFYVARWLVPCGLAKKEDFLPRVQEWVNSATEEDLRNLVADGWIDIKTAEEKLAQIGKTKHTAAS